jgi:hypothetical protein
MSAFEYVDIDYKEGRLGVRFEPKNKDIIDAFVTHVPPDMRIYISDKRRWIFDPVIGPFIAQVIQDFLPNTPVHIEERHKDLILSLLFGPETLPGRILLESPVQLMLGGPSIRQWRDIGTQTGRFQSMHPSKPR